ncbi:uncharacterized protein LOC111352923 [Spodoptera litura]|uniref:Uncharacterized protein LOC111352923 n=1 Tax=Spodoptera litura TaxID=69820 RepID=A0A9J7IQH1_SPOLT|nr:uncharacterized protein LOC111352923 [Spodoptera litura]
MKFFIVLVFTVLLVLKISSYKTYSTLHSIVFTKLNSMKESTHSEYYLGKCSPLNKEILWIEHFTYKDLKGRMMIQIVFLCFVIQGHMNFTEKNPKLPGCIRIKSKAAHTDLVRYNSYHFTICFGRLTLHIRGKITYHHYYEWFIPLEMREGIDWFIYFYRVKV